MGRWSGERGGKDSGNKKHKWEVKTDGEVENSVENVEAKEPICPTHGHELRWGGMLVGVGCRAEGNKVGEVGEL